MITPDEAVWRKGHKSRRLNITFTSQAYAELEALARLKGKTMAETIRDALALETLAINTIRSGGRVLVEEPGGRVRELMLRR